MRADIFFVTLRERRRALIGYGIGLIGLIAMYVALWPTVREQADSFQELIENYPDALKSLFGIEEITSAAGYLNTELFSFMAPLIFIAFAIGMATDSTAGEEERKTIDLLMANPVTRTRVIVEKFAAMAVGLGLLAAVLTASLWFGGVLVDLDIGLGRLVEASFSQLMLGTLFGAVGLLFASLTGKRGLSRGLASGVAVAAFLLSSLAPLADWLSPYREISPMYHAVAIQPLRNGIGLENVAYLLVFGAVFFVGASVAFERRDLAT